MAHQLIKPISISRSYPNFDGAWYLVHFIPQGQEPFSVSIREFKDNEANAVKVWSKLASECFASLNIKIDYIVRPLGSKELKSSGTKSLDSLGAALAATLKCQYVPETMLKKKHIGPMHYISRKVDRIKALEGIYQVNPDSNLTDGNSFLIIDDISTSGATVNAIRSELEKYFPTSKIYFYTLARTERLEGCNNQYDPSIFD